MSNNTSGLLTSTNQVLNGLHGFVDKWMCVHKASLKLDFTWGLLLDISLRLFQPVEIYLQVFV